MGKTLSLKWHSQIINEQTFGEISLHKSNTTKHLMVFATQAGKNTKITIKFIMTCLWFIVHLEIEFDLIKTSYLFNISNAWSLSEGFSRIFLFKTWKEEYWLHISPYFTINDFNVYARNVWVVKQSATQNEVRST